MRATWQNFFENDRNLVAVPVAHRVNGRNKIIGSATYILPGVFLTASHLAEEWLKQGLLSQDQAPGATNEDYGIDVLHILRDKKLIIWRIGKIHFIENSDLAVLVAQKIDGDLAQDFLDANLTVQIDFHIPSKGQKIISLGYPDTRTTSDQKKHTLQLRESTGIVEDIHLNGFGLVKSACVQTNLQVDGGMSGGPVINETGKVCAINSSGYKYEDGEYTSFASMLFKLAHTKLELPLESSELKSTSLVALAAKGYITASGLNHFIHQGDVVRWHYNMVCPQCSV
jgi:hypothetical protein